MSEPESDPENQSVATEPEEEDLDMFVTVNVRAQNGQESRFKMRGEVYLYKLMNAFCSRHGLQRASVRFLFDGVRLGEMETPDMVGLENGDTIDAMLLQVGGSACQ